MTDHTATPPRKLTPDDKRMLYFIDILEAEILRQNIGTSGIYEGVKLPLLAGKSAGASTLLAPMNERLAALAEPDKNPVKIRMETPNGYTAPKAIIANVPPRAIAHLDRLRERIYQQEKPLKNVPKILTLLDLEQLPISPVTPIHLFLKEAVCITPIARDDDLEELVVPIPQAAQHAMKRALDVLKKITSPDMESTMTVGIGETSGFAGRVQPCITLRGKNVSEQIAQLERLIDPPEHERRHPSIASQMFASPEITLPERLALSHLYDPSKSQKIGYS